MGEVGAWLRLGFAVAVLAGAVYLMARRWDVRLVLLGAGVALSLAAGAPLTIPDAFARAMVATMVGPICASMGFAAVLGATGCDRHLTRLLVAPLRRAGWALVPGGVLAAYLVNLAVPSQTSTAAAVGPVLIPLLLAAGVPAERAGAALLLGASFGGDLLNPGAQDVQSIAAATGLPAQAIHARVLPAGLAGALVAALLMRGRPGAPLTPPPDAPPEPPINVVKALIPLVPVTLLLLAYAGAPWLRWLVEMPDEEGWAGFEGALPVVRAVLIGAALALAVSFREVEELGRRYFAEMGSAYGSIIALTITAQCFGAGLAALGVGEALLGLTGGAPWALALLAVLFPWGLAVLSGSGSGPILTYAQTFLKGLAGHQDAAQLAALACLAGACGRTMSPAATVVLYCAGLVGASPLRLIRIALLPLLAGAFVALGVAMAGARLT
jgi:DcuC family C4-dicarboxylate transporter